MKVNKCVNCGAPVHGKFCAHCGTEYIPETMPGFNQTNQTVNHQVNIGGGITAGVIEADVVASGIVVNGCGNAVGDGNLIIVPGTRMEVNDALIEVREDGHIYVNGVKVF